MKVEDVVPIANSVVRKYDWNAEQYGWGVKVTVNDGEKFAAVKITSGENIEAELEKAIAAVDAHEYGEIE